jgi:hypothetical protein
METNSCFPARTGGSVTSIVKKLGLKPGMRALVLGAPSGYLKSLAPLPEGFAVSESIGGTNDFVQFFATRKSEIEKSGKRLLQSSAPPVRSSGSLTRRRRPAWTAT